MSTTAQQVSHSLFLTTRTYIQPDVNAECSYYTYQPAVDAKSQFPTLWDIAGLVPGDTDAQTLFNQVVAQVNSTVPNVQVKGTPNGDFCR